MFCLLSSPVCSDLQLLVKRASEYHALISPLSPPKLLKLSIRISLVFYCNHKVIEKLNCSQVRSFKNTFFLSLSLKTRLFLLCQASELPSRRTICASLSCAKLLSFAFIIHRQPNTTVPLYIKIIVYVFSQCPSCCR